MGFSPFLYFFIIFIFIFYIFIIYFLFLYFFIIYFLFITFLYKLLIYNFIIFYFDAFLSGFSLLNVNFAKNQYKSTLFWHFGWIAIYSSYKRQKSFNLLKFCSWYGQKSKLLRWLIPRGVSSHDLSRGTTVGRKACNHKFAIFFFQSYFYIHLAMFLPWRTSRSASR